jgi:hypothetical protein
VNASQADGLAALIVDYALTIAIRAAAGASEFIAYLRGLAPARLPLQSSCCSSWRV